MNGPKCVCFLRGQKTVELETLKKQTNTAQVAPKRAPLGPLLGVLGGPFGSASHDPPEGSGRDGVLGPKGAHSDPKVTHKDEAASPLGQLLAPLGATGDPNGPKCVCFLRGQKTVEIETLKEQTTNTPKEAKLDSKMWP